MIKRRRKRTPWHKIETVFDKPRRKRRRQKHSPSQTAVRDFEKMMERRGRKRRPSTEPLLFLVKPEIRVRDKKQEARE